MKIFYRTFFIAAISATAFLVWGKKNHSSKERPEQETSQKKATRLVSASNGKKGKESRKDTLPSSGFRTAATLALSAVKAVDKTTALPGDTLTYTITVQNNGNAVANDLTITDKVDVNTTALADSLWYSPIAMDDTYESVGNVGITVPAENGVLLNDQKGSPVAALRTFSRTTSKGGTVTLHADGSFDYTPAAGYSGTDTVQYLLENRAGVDMGVIHISISTVAWFINNNSAAATENGSLATPFKSITSFQAVNNGSGNNPKAGHTIFFYESNTAYNGSLTLLTGQKLIGQDASTSLAAIAGISLPAYSKPLPVLDGANATSVTLTSSGNAVTLTNGGNNYLIRGLTIGNTTGIGITGTNFGTLTIAETGINGTGQALSLTDGTLASPGALGSNFKTLSSASGAYGVYLKDVSGSLLVAAGSNAISGSTTTAFYVSGGNATIQYPGSLAGTRPVDIQNTSNSNITLSGNITATNQGINLTGNTTSTITFSGASKTLTTATNPAVNIGTNTGSVISFTGGGLVINTTTGDGFKASGAVGSLVVSGVGNTINSNGGTALNISDATIGAGGLTFQSIASSNAQKGIYLNNTGSAGGLTITGTGTAASGGTIQNSLLAGIEINNAYHLNLSYVRMVNANQSTSAQGGLLITNLQGTSQLENCSFTDARVRNGYIINSTGSLTLRVKSCDFGFTTATANNDLRQDCFEMRTRNVATATVILTNSQFRRAGTKGIQLFAENNSTMTASVANCTVDRAGGQMAGVEVGSSQSAKMKANVDGNPLINATNEVAINVYAGGFTDAKTEATVRNNTSVSGAGNVELYTDPVVQAFSNGDAQGVVLIQANTITNPDGQAILTRTVEGTGTMNATVTNNTITIPASGWDGIEVRAGADATATSNRNCSYVHDNQVSNNGTQGGNAFMVQAATPGTVVQLQQKSGANASTVAALWTANNNSGTGTNSYVEPGATIQIGTNYGCLTPTNLTAPTLAVQTPVETAALDNMDSTDTKQQGGQTAETAIVPLANTGTPATAKMEGTLSGETITVSGVTMPVGKTFKVQFKVRVNTPFPAGVCTVSNQAQLTGSNITATQTNTVTTNVLVKPVITSCQANITADASTCTSSQSFAVTASGCPAPTYTYYLVATGEEITSPYAFPVGTTTVKAKASNTAGADSCTFTVTIKGTKATWTGATSNDWNTASNWSCGAVPDVNTDVTINAGPANMPVLLANGGAKNIVLGSGATLTISSNASFEVKADFTSAGTITANGTVVFSGTGDQVVPATAYNNVTISGGGAKRLSGNATINGTLGLSSGMLSVESHQLTLGASANISGASAGSFIVTGGSGAVKKLGLGNGGITGDFVFPVGVSASSYTPATISNAGALDNFTLSMIDNVYRSYSGTTPSGSQITTMVVNKTWFVNEEVAGGSDVTLTLQWNSSDESTAFDRSSSYVAHKTSTAWLAGPAANASAGTEPSSYTRTWAGITNFSPFGVGSTGSVLPVQLIAFKGFQQGHLNKLEWTAAQEQLQHYEVERSGSQTGFVKIGEVKALGGSNVRSYNWQDASPLSGTNFYRLRMIHPDGTATYSDVIAINRGAGTPVVSIYPTPVKDKTLYLQFANLERGTYALTLYNSAGQAVYTGSVAHNGGSAVAQLQLPATVTKGAYILHISKDGQRFTSNVLIQ